MGDDSIGGIIAEETSRQTVILIFTLVGTVLVIYVAAKLGEPDSFRRLKISSALAVKRYAQKQVDKWQEIADKAATIYNNERY